MVFASEKEAISYCEGVDVATGGWKFFSGEGLPLEAAFSVPAQVGRFVVSHGRYSLRPGSGEPLSQFLSQVALVEGPPGLQTAEEVERALTSHSSGTPAASAERER